MQYTPVVTGIYSTQFPEQYMGINYKKSAKKIIHPLKEKKMGGKRKKKKLGK